MLRLGTPCYTPARLPSVFNSIRAARRQRRFGCAYVEVVRSVGDTLVRRRRASPSLLLRLWALAAAGAVPVRLRPAAGPETTRQDRVGY